MSIVTKDGKELVIKKPTAKDHREALKVYNGAFNDAIQSKALVRARLDDFLQEQGLWNEEKAAKLAAIKKELVESETTLERGGIKLSVAKEVAIGMIKLRNEWSNLISQRSQLDNNTAEGQADNARFDFLVWTCLVYKDTETKFYPTLDDYLNADDEVAGQAAAAFSKMYYKLDTDFETKLPEYKFLRKFGFVNEKLRLINKDGHLVDLVGNLVDEHGRLVNDKGELVDSDGNLVNEDGTLLAAPAPFLDDDGKPVLLDEEVVEVALEEPSDLVPAGE